MPDLILASTSPYRRQLLELLNLPFRTVDPRVDEDAFKQKINNPVALAERLAMAKAEAASLQFPNDIVIGSDQLATIDGDILGKPGTPEAAVEQLCRLSGRAHELVTAVCMIAPETRRMHTDTTKLTMRQLTRTELTRYVEQDDPTDCAGSYKIESAGIALFDRIETDDFTAIRGLPLIAVVSMLRELGVSVP